MLRKRMPLKIFCCLMVICLVTGCSKPTPKTDPRIIRLTKKIEKDSQNAALYNKRGFYYEMLGQHDLAINDFSKAIELEPETANYYFNRGNVNSSHQKLKEALSDYNKAISISQDDADFYVNRGLVEKKLGHIEKAIENFSAAIQLDNADPVLYYKRGELYKQQQQQTLADADFKKVEELEAELKKKQQSTTK